MIFFFFYDFFIPRTHNYFRFCYTNISLLCNVTCQIKSLNLESWEKSSSVSSPQIDVTDGVVCSQSDWVGSWKESTATRTYGLRWSLIACSLSRAWFSCVKGLQLCGYWHLHQPFSHHEFKSVILKNNKPKQTNKTRGRARSSLVGLMSVVIYFTKLTLADY